MATNIESSLPDLSTVGSRCFCPTSGSTDINAITPNYVTAHQYTLFMTSREDNFNCMADFGVIALMSVDEK